MSMACRILVGVILLLAPVVAANDGTSLSEYQVKAAYLYNFLKFVEWPADKDAGPFVVGVLGRNPFGDALEQTVRGKLVNGRPVVVRRYERIQDASEAHVVFIARPEPPRVHFAIHGVVTVGESDSFLGSGGVVNFVLEGKHICFEISLDAAKAVGVRVSSQLLKLGRHP